MTPGARLEAARLVLAEWQDGCPVERALTQWARGARYAGSKDRRAVRDHVYDILRQRGVCADLGGGEDPRALILGLARLSGLAADLFADEGYGPAPLSDAEALRFSEPFVLDRSKDTPGWLRPRLAGAYGQWSDIEAAMALRAPLYLRVNVQRCSLKEAQSRLAADGIMAEPAECATALEVRDGAPRLAGSQAYAEGLVEPQDLSVQKALALIDWPDGKILDYCAGGGGKALAIAAATGRPIDIHDAHPRRLADAGPRAARAGATLRQIDDPSGPFDLVLTDVPCSGSGTWRRDPEAKWRLTAAGLDELLAVQAAILDRAAALTHRIVYMTCSLLPEENGDQVDAFLSRHPGWNCLQSRQFTPLDASDGFYVAELPTGGF